VQMTDGAGMRGGFSPLAAGRKHLAATETKNASWENPPTTVRSAMFNRFLLKARFNPTRGSDRGARTGRPGAIAPVSSLRGGNGLTGYLHFARMYSGNAARC
jgi:hypothetical protein